MKWPDLADLGKLGAWWLIIGAVLLLLLWEGGKKWVPALVEWAVGRLSAALAGTRLLRRWSLRRYRAQVAISSAKLPVLFAADVGADVGADVSAVYVPLKAVGPGDGDDAYSRIRATDHVVVLGPPGSGKSMLLRHSMLMWARGEGAGRVPVLIELHRCNGNSATLEDLVVEQFDRDGFPKASLFVERALRSGGLSVLFDGLDEVNATERARVALALRDFVRRHRKCQAVVTCRTAIYDRDLAPEIDATFHVLEFDERLIRRFLRQWPGVRQVERLMAALRDNPRIMQLAANPLLLTMIAYLYGDDTHQDRVLPHSRAEFYQEATQALLSRLKNNANRFQGPAKKAVLRRLALLAQDMPASAADRRTLSYEQVLTEISATLPKLTIAVSEAEAVLREIVDRSGLLLAVDGGERYQFAHLSLQEYLAAEALANDVGGLLERYRRAPDDWRETVKLWCGTVADDSAPVIDAVWEVDQVLAFECLADAQVVDPAVAESVTDHFRRRLAGGTPAVIKAFGAVAADRRPRGRAIYRSLVEAVRAGGAPAVAAALAATKLPEAARVLFDVEAFDELVGMGDLAVPVLATAAKAGREEALDHLKTIATPAAAEVLASFIWDESAVAYRAAWHLAVLIGDVDVEAALAEVVPRVDAPRLDWVWAPFGDPAAPVIAVVAARVAHLISTSTSFDADPTPIDPRLAIPLISVRASAKLQIDGMYLPAQDGEFREYLSRTGMWRLLSGALAGDDADTRRVESTCRAWAVEAGLEPLDVALLFGLQPSVRYRLLMGLVDPVTIEPVLWRRSGRRLTVRERDWVEVNRRRETYDVALQPAFWAAFSLVAVFWLTTAAGVLLKLLDGWRWGPQWIGWTAWGAVVAATLVWLVVTISGDWPDVPDMLRTPLVGFADRQYWTGTAGAIDVGGMLVSAGWFLMMVSGPLVTVLALVAGADEVGWGPAAATVAVWAALVLGLLSHVERRQRGAHNSLLDLLELAEVTARTRTSVIAG